VRDASARGRALERAARGLRQCPHRRARAADLRDPHWWKHRSRGSPSTDIRSTGRVRRPIQDLLTDCRVRNLLRVRETYESDLASSLASRKQSVISPHKPDYYIYILIGHRDQSTPR